MKYYLFPQQGKDLICHCMPAINLQILQQIRAKAHDLRGCWQSAEQWNGKLFKGIVAWLQSMDELTNPKAGEPGHFANYQNHLLLNGIHLDHIYTATGKKYYKACWNPLKNLQRFWLTPYNFVNAREHPEVLDKMLPLYATDEAVWLFNCATNQYQQLPELNCVVRNNNNVIYLANIKKFVKITDDQKEYLQFNKFTCLQGYKLKNSRFMYGYKYQYLPEQAKYNVYFHVGLFQLIMLALGIDRDNNQITKDHVMYNVYNELREHMQKDQSNPWAQTTFNAQYSFEYHLAEIFKQYPQLMKEVAGNSSCFFNTWEHYLELANLYDSSDKEHRRPLSDKYQFLPGKEQILAYSFSQSLRIASAAAVSAEALYAVLEIPKVVLPFVWFSRNKRHSSIIASLYKKNINGNSFMDSWHKIQKILFTRCEHRDFLSFDGHGAVVSFAEDVLAMQQAAPCSNKQLRQDLGFAVIDSLYADATKPFYRKTLALADTLSSWPKLSIQHGY